MDDDASTGTRLPIAVSAYGPLHDLAVRAHELTQTSRSHEALAFLDVYEPFARDFGDEKTVGFLMQSRMYAYMYLGWLPEALAVGERLLSRHESAGNAVAAAKAVADLADVYLRADRVAEAMRCLARAELLLERTGVRNDRYVAALGSLMGAATVGALYETVRSAYLQISQWWVSAGQTDISAGYDYMYAEMLLEWGLRLAHLGEHTEARERLQTAADIFSRWCDTYAARGASDEALGFTAAHALALAKLGQVDRARDLAAVTVLPLREQLDWEGARRAHLALGIALRERGDLTVARRELLAAAELGHLNSNSSYQLIIQVELAVLAGQLVGEEAARDFIDTINAQARELWQLRLQRVTMLRQVRQREEQEAARKRAETALMLDALTGLGNRRRFDQLMADIDTERIPEPSVLLVIDVDKFKAINDTYSHSVGDQVLRQIAKVLRAKCRPHDVPIRYAGDEFVIFLRADLAEAHGVAERIRAAVRAINLDHIAPGLRVSISIGAASLRPGMSARQLFNDADANLYQAKRGGRDRVAA